MRGWLITIVLVAPALVGCVATTPGATREDLASADALVTLDYPIRIVPVGFEAFDGDALLDAIPPHSPLVAGMRYYVTGALQHEPLQYDVRYEVVEAPDAFATELFAYAASIAEDDKPDAWLASYDRAGEQRVCEAGALAPAPSVPRPPLPVAPPSVSDPTAPPCDPIQRIDAKKIEAWIEENRGKHGLDWKGAGEAIFLLDTYSTGGLPQESYHQYFIDDGTGLSRLKTLRAWGGEHHFVFLDVGAAPNAYDFRPWIDYDADEFRTTADPPIWDLADDMETFYENLGWNVHDAVDMVWARDPIYPFEYAEKYVLQSYVIIDTNAHANPGSPLANIQSLDYEAMTDEEMIQRSFAELTPWADVELNVTYIYLPGDDAALAAALEDAKDRESTDFVDFGILKKHFRDHWDEYVPTIPGARVYPTFAFVLAAPSKGLFAYSDSDETGRSFGTFFNVADAMLCAGPYARVPVCFTEDALGKDYWAGLWNGLFVHEVGHSFGLMHPHDTFAVPDGPAHERLNWLWDSTSSPMTYRHVLHDFAQYDKDIVLRGNAVNVARDVLDDPDASDAARASAQRALERVRSGDYAGALAAAGDAQRARGSLAAAAASGLDLGEPVSLQLSVATGYEPVGSPAGVPFYVLPTWLALDALPMGAPYQEVPIEWPADAQALKLEVREVDAPSHSKWAEYSYVADKEGEYVAGLFNNGFDTVVLMDRSRCDGGCSLVLIGYSGVDTGYDVSFTPVPMPK